MSRLVLIALLSSASFTQVDPQIIRIVQIPQPTNPRYTRTFNTSEVPIVNDGHISQNSESSATVLFEFLKPRGLGIYIPGPYPPSYRYKLTFHININKEFNGWKAADWNEGVIIQRGSRWAYTFPQIQVKQGDIIYYWIEAEGADWEKGYRGKYEVTQAAHGTQTGGGDRWGDNSCFKRSVTTYSGGRTACAGEKMIQSYTQVAPKYKRPGAEFFMESVKQIGGLEPEETFTIFRKENIVWDATRTVFVPSLLEDTYGASAVDSTNFTLKECTSELLEQCSAGAMGYLILPPILSARHSTRNSFSFCYGVLEVTAKLPRGDWIVPELWLMPKDEAYGNSSGKIVLAMSRGNLELSNTEQDYSGRVLEAGVETSSGYKMFRKIGIKPWSSDYHRYKLVWTKEKIEFLVDDESIGTVEPSESGLEPNLNGTKMAPFDKEFYLVFGVHVGGDKDFSDSVGNKPWKNYEPKNKLKFWRAKSSWYPTWGVDSPLYIKSLKVTALN